MIKRLTAIAASWLALGAMQSPPAAAPELQMWRLDCGTVQVGNLDLFSDAFLYAGQSKTLTDSCYLIRHGENYLLWDTGLPGELAGKTVPMGDMSLTVTRRVVDQLRDIGVPPERVNFVGISHRHEDHIGQAADFPKATLFIGDADFEAIRKGESARRLKPWIDGGARVERVDGDVDIFRDGSVVMLGMPGHTPGHHSLLVRLPKTGPVLLTGDLYHFYENVKNRGVPSFNTDRADTLASMDRFDAMARKLKAKVVIQHEPADIGKLPAFPQSAQ